MALEVKNLLTNHAYSATILSYLAGGEKVLGIQEITNLMSPQLDEDCIGDDLGTYFHVKNALCDLESMV